MKDRRKSKRMRSILLVAYLFACLCIVVFAYGHLSRIARDYNAQHMELITGLYAEKVNNAMGYINHYAAEEAKLLEVTEQMADPQDMLELLQQRLGRMAFADRGLILKNGEILASACAISDIQKMGLDTQALESSDTFISDPYQSSETGSMILTVFVPLENSGEIRSLFVSVTMEDIRQLGISELLRGKVGVHLLKADSENYVTCISTEADAVGNWNNLLLQQKYFTYAKGYSYHQWVHDMQSGIPGGEFTANIRGKDCTIAYQSISSMQGWYVVVSLANADVADITRQFSEWGGIYGAVIIGLTVGYMTFIVILEKRDKRHYMGLSSTDSLTGILNRAAFQRAVETEIQKKTPGVLIFLDVDNFKHYNDLYGHQNGDLCLVHFADTMKLCFPERTILGRYGGDEFVVFLQNAGAKQAQACMELFQRAVSHLQLPDGEELAMSASAGGALFPMQGEDYVSLCRQADIMLYDVKRNGKAGFKMHISEED